MAGGTVDDRLHAFHISLPGTIGPSVGVRNLNTERNTLVAKFALSHPLHLLAVTILPLTHASLIIIAEVS